MTSDTAEILAYSVPAFCKAVGISPRKFYALQQTGDGPKVTRIGRRTLIRVEAARRWLELTERNGKAAHGRTRKQTGRNHAGN